MAAVRATMRADNTALARLPREQLLAWRPDAPAEASVRLLTEAVRACMQEPHLEELALAVCALTVALWDAAPQLRGPCGHEALQALLLALRAPARAEHASVSRALIMRYVPAFVSGLRLRPHAPAEILDAVLRVATERDGPLAFQACACLALLCGTPAVMAAARAGGGLEALVAAQPQAAAEHASGSAAPPLTTFASTRAVSSAAQPAQRAPGAPVLQPACLAAVVALAASTAPADALADADAATRALMLTLTARCCLPAADDDAAFDDAARFASEVHRRCAVVARADAAPGEVRAFTAFLMRGLWAHLRDSDSVVSAYYALHKLSCGIQLLLAATQAHTEHDRTYLITPICTLAVLAICLRGLEMSTAPDAPAALARARLELVASGGVRTAIAVLQRCHKYDNPWGGIAGALQGGAACSVRGMRARARPPEPAGGARGHKRARDGEEGSTGAAQR